MAILLAVAAVATVAAALFFAGISTKRSVPRQRLTVLGLGYALFLGTAVRPATLPLTVSVCGRGGCRVIK